MFLDSADKNHPGILRDQNIQDTVNFLTSPKQTCEYAGIKIYEYAGIQISKNTGMQTCKYAGMQTFEYAGMQTCEYARDANI